jgi:hypothetical protein
MRCAMPYTAALSEIPPGAPGTVATVDAMERAVAQGLRDPEVVLYAQDLVRHVPERDRVAEATAIFDAVRETLRYTNDPLGVELVKTPTFILREIERHGRATLDCDDASVWLATLLRAVGMQTRFKVIRASRASPGEFTHVFVEALIHGRWQPLDPIARQYPAGAAPRALFGSMTWGEEDSMAYETLGGVGSPAGTRQYGGAPMYGGRGGPTARMRWFEDFLNQRSARALDFRAAGDGTALSGPASFTELGAVGDRLKRAKRAGVFGRRRDMHRPGSWTRQWRARHRGGSGAPYHALAGDYEFTELRGGVGDIFSDFFGALKPGIEAAADIGTKLVAAKLESKVQKITDKAEKAGVVKKPTVLPPPVAPQRPGLFQKVDPQTGQLVTDWLKVGGGVAVLGGIGFLAIRALRRRRANPGRRRRSRSRRRR